MKKKHQFVLILGIINVILPVIPVLSHRGWFGMVENGWKFIWVAAIMILLPLFHHWRELLLEAYN